MAENPFVTRWKTLLIEKCPPRDRYGREMFEKEWDRSNAENFTGFFGEFIPAELPDIFEGVPFGAEIEARVRAYFEATHNQPPGSIYFLPPGNPTTTREQIETRVREHLASFTAISRHEEQDPLAQILENVELVWVEKIVYDSSTDTPNTWLYDVICDFGFGLEEHESPLHVLSEAFYSIANDPYLQDYLEWPLVKSPPFPDPFAPYFWLWSEGVSLDIANETQCHITRSN